MDRKAPFRLAIIGCLLAVALLPWGTSPSLASSAAGVTPSSASQIVINEVMFYPRPGGHEWIELKNTGPSPVDVDSYGITDNDGHWYSIPVALPPIPPGALLVVVFDGAGSGGDDYSFADGVATLHTPSGLVNVFENDADQCALYLPTADQLHTLYLPLAFNDYAVWNPPVPGPPLDPPAPSLIDFVAWGAEPGSQADEAAGAGIWFQEWYVSLYRGLGVETEDLLIQPGESIGLLPGSETSDPDDWTIYTSSQVTQGRQNVVPVISWYYPPAGATVDGATFTVSWNPVQDATGYRFQLDDQSNFSSPVADVTLAEPAYMPSTPVPEGTYYWRVKVLFGAQESPWSSGVQIHSLTLPSPTAAGVDAQAIGYKVLGITWQLQHKDTNMLCLDDCAETGGNAWNAPHNTRGTHGQMYCVRASVSMLASYYGGDLSQDRITYEIFGGGDPEGDLGHDVGVTKEEALDALSWGLGTNLPSIDGKPTFDQIKAWIDADRPIHAVIPGHSRVIDGYFEFDILFFTWRFLHILDPWDQAKWVSYADDDIIFVQVGPAGTSGAPSVRSDEDVDGDGTADTMDDSDGDGVCDFDERNRFNLSHTDSDTDDDLVQDLPDIREYVFDAAGNWSLRNADFDGDGVRKELDPDNDYAQNNGLIDGCEDSDRDGRYEAGLGETDNFKPSDDMTLHVQLRWPLHGSDVDLHVVKPGSAMWSGGDVYFGNPSPDWGEQGLTCDDPWLDIDCITTCTVENIRLGKLENGTYRIIVHYWWDHDQGPTSPTVILWLQGVRHSFGPRRLSDDEVWEVASVEWPSMVITAVDSVTSVHQWSDLDIPDVK